MPGGRKNEVGEDKGGGDGGGRDGEGRGELSS